MSIRSLSLVLALGASMTAGCFDIGGGDDDDDDDDGSSGPVDSDGDGLDDELEAELGLDPEAADTDLDGFLDNEEVDAGTDGTLCWSVPTGWPQCQGKAEADGLEETGYGEGDTIGNWTAIDQFGDTIEFWQFYGQVVVLDMSAGWCGPCRSAAEGAEDEYQEWKDKGVQWMHLMVDDNSYDGYVTDEDFVSEWAEDYGLTFPVVWDDSYSGYPLAYYEFYMEGMIQGVPTFVIIDQDMVVHDWWAGESAAKLSSTLGDLVGE